MPDLALASGLNATANVTELVKGQGALGGTFAVTYRGATTAPLPATAGDAELVAALQALPVIDLVSVTHSAVTQCGGRAYAVTFTHYDAKARKITQNAGDVPQATVAGTGTTLTGAGASVSSATTTPGTDPVQGTFFLRYGTCEINTVERCDTTIPIQHNATAAEVAFALRGMWSGIGSRPLDAQTGPNPDPATFQQTGKLAVVRGAGSPDQGIVASTTSSDWPAVTSRRGGVFSIPNGTTYCHSGTYCVDHTELMVTREGPDSNGAYKWNVSFPQIGRAHV